MLKVAFNMTWLMEIIRICLEKHLLKKYYVIKHDRYQRGLPSMVYKFFDKKWSGSGVKNENLSKQQLAEELHKPGIRKFENRKVQSSFMDNIWVIDLTNMQLISNFNKGIRFLLCVFDIVSKYAWVVP